MVAMDLRNNRISPEKGHELVGEFEGTKPHSLEIFLEYVGLTEVEFNEIVRRTAVAPHRPDFAIARWARKPWDFDRWHRERPRGGAEGAGGKIKAVAGKAET